MSGKSVHNKSCERVRELAQEDKAKLQEARRKKKESEVQLRNAVVDAKKAHEDRVSKSVSRMKQEKFEAALRIKKEKELLKEKINESEAVVKERYRKQKLLVAPSHPARARERGEEAPADREKNRERCWPQQQRPGQNQASQERVGGVPQQDPARELNCARADP